MSSGRRSAAPLWESEHKVGHHKLAINAKPDRGLLKVIEEQGRQICQVKVRMFQLSGDSEKVGIEKCFAFMKDVAEEYANDAWPKAEVYLKRDAALAAAGLRHRRRAMNKPAASRYPEIEKEKEE